MCFVQLILKLSFFFHLYLFFVISYCSYVLSSKIDWNSIVFKLSLLNLSPLDKNAFSKLSGKLCQSILFINCKQLKISFISTVLDTCFLKYPFELGVCVCLCDGPNECYVSGTRVIIGATMSACNHFFPGINGTFPNSNSCLHMYYGNYGSDLKLRRGLFCDKFGWIHSGQAQSTVAQYIIVACRWLKIHFNNLLLNLI